MKAKKFSQRGRRGIGTTENQRENPIWRIRYVWGTKKRIAFQDGGIKERRKERKTGRKEGVPVGCK